MQIELSVGHRPPGGPPVPLRCPPPSEALWLVNDDVLSQQTISLLNTSFSLSVFLSLSHLCARSLVVYRSPGRIHLVNSANAYSTLCRKCNGTNAAGINVGMNVGTRGRSPPGYFPQDDFDTFM